MKITWRSWKVLTLLPILAAVYYSQSSAPATERTRRQPVKRSYSCGPCSLPNCRCPSENIPGNLTLEQTPQFIMLTFDDAVSTSTFPVAQAVLSANTNAINNSAGTCPMPGGFYVSTDYTDYWLVQQLYATGNEIACHTIDHLATPNVAQINGSISAISTFGMIPRTDIVGFRAPYLDYNMSTFQNIKDLGLKYECTSPISPRLAPWPYTYDYGMPYSCETGVCDNTRQFAGLWSVPMTTLLSPEDDTEYASMDPVGDAGVIMNLLQYNFKIHWKSRLPFGLWLHAAWLLIDTTRTKTLNDFYVWAKAYTNNTAYFVTPAQLVQWTQDPVPLSQMPSWKPLQCPWKFNTSSTTPETCNGLDDNMNGLVDEGLTAFCNLGSYYTHTCAYCPAVEPSESNPVPSVLPGWQAPDTSPCAGGKVIPPSGCVQGKWQNCTCVCIGEGNSTSNGYCRDGDGACTILKTYSSSGYTCANVSASGSTTVVIPGQYNDGNTGTATSKAPSSSTTVVSNDQTHIAMINTNSSGFDPTQLSGGKRRTWIPYNVAIAMLAFIIYYK